MKSTTGEVWIGQSLTLCPSPTQRNELIENHRDAAFKVALKLLQRSGISLQHQELRSTVDMALCEAALRFRQTGRARFFTYAYFFIKGEIFKAVRSVIESRSQLDPQRGDDGEDSQLEQLSDEPKQRPDEIASCKQTLRHALYVFQGLEKREREIWTRNALGGEKVAKIARDLGLSAGRAFEIRKHALRKIRESFDGIKPTGTDG